MGIRSRQSAARPPQDVGTLWSMRHGELRARCALLAWSDEWEVCVLVDGVAILAERLTGATDAFELAEVWRQRLRTKGWEQIGTDSTRA